VVQITVLVVAVAAGLFSPTWRKAWLITLVAFIAISAVQTPMVIAGDDIDSPFVYWAVQALTLAVGIGLAWALFARRHRGARRLA
jgi:hydrogenase/urease accessory protein HupE